MAREGQPGQLSVRSCYTASVRHIGIVGAGIAGLTVAFRRSLRGDRISLYEASPRLGGQLHTERSEGFLVEHGAEGFIAGSTALAELAAATGLASQLVDQEVTETCTFDGNQLLRLAPGEAGKMLGFQVGPRAFGKGIQSFSGGMSQIVEALQRRLGPHSTCLPNTPIQTLRRRGNRWEMLLESGSAIEVDAVVVATSAAAAARLLSAAFGSLASALADSPALSSVSVSLAYPRQAIAHQLDATGFVVAEGAQIEGLRACTFASSKLRGRALPQLALLRLFFRPTEQDLDMNDAGWISRAERCAKRVLGIDGPASHHWVSRWVRALPVFDAEHRERVDRLEAHLRHTGVSLAGAGFHGAGIDGAVRSAEAAARALDAEPYA